MDDNKYFKLLLTQFKQAKGNNNLNTFNDISKKDFLDWTLSRLKSGEAYTQFLDYLGLCNFRDSDTIEVNKGAFDSVVLNYDSLIASPFMDEFIIPNRVQNGNFIISQGFPLLLKNKDYSIYDFNANSSNMLTFMNQNPYLNREFNNWDLLHNSNNFNIIAGVYGDINDKDIKDKILLLNNLKNKLEREYICDGGRVGDNYVYVLASKPSNLVMK